MGLSKEEKVYVPSSALLEDIKKLTEAPSQVLAIKGLNLKNILFLSLKKCEKQADILP